MGCGKSKHDVASGNTVLQRKKSSVSSQENGTENKDINNNNVVDNVTSGVQVEQKKSETVKKESDVEVKDDKVVNDVKAEAEKINVQEEKETEKTNVQEEKETEKTNVQEEKEAEPEGGEGKTQETIVAEGHSESEKSKGEKDDSLKENEQKINDAETANVTKDKMPAENEKEDVSMKEEDIKDTNVSTSEGEEKDLKAEEGQ